MRRVFDEKCVVLQQQRHALLIGQLQIDAGALAHGVDEGIGHAHIAHFFAFAFHEHGPGRIKLAQGVPDQAVETFLARLGQAGDVAEHGAAVVGQGFKVEHLGALGGQGLQQAGFAAAGGAADHAVMQALCPGGEVVHQGCAPGFVTAFDEGHLEADGAQDGGQGAAAVAAAPAVDQGFPAAGSIDQLALDVGGDVARGQGCAAFFGLKGVDLLVQGADDDALGVVQRGPVDGTGDVVERVFVFAPGIDDGFKLVELAQGLGGGQGLDGHALDYRFGSSFCRAGQTLSASRGCAASLGWMRSL